MQVCNVGAYLDSSLTTTTWHRKIPNKTMAEFTLIRASSLGSKARSFPRRHTCTLDASTAARMISSYTAAPPRTSRFRTAHSRICCRSAAALLYHLYLLRRALAGTFFLLSLACVRTPALSVSPYSVPYDTIWTQDDRCTVASINTHTKTSIPLYIHTKEQEKGETKIQRGGESRRYIDLHTKLLKGRTAGRGGKCLARG